MKGEIGEFLNYLTYERNVSHNTIDAYRNDLDSFVGFLCDDYFTMARDQLDLRRVDHLAVRSYLAHLSRRSLRRSSIARHLSALRSFFKFLMREGIAEANPARNVATPKGEKHLPSVLQTSDIALLLEQPDLATPLGMRDRAWLELLYASGLRIGELVGIDVDDVELRARLVKVRGKGAKERIVPFGSKAEEGVRAWMAVREVGPEQHALFTNYRGERITARSVRRRLATHAAPFVRHASAQCRRRPARHPGAPRPRLAVHHAEVHAPQRFAIDRGVSEGASESRVILSRADGKDLATSGWDPSLRSG